MKIKKTWFCAVPPTCTVEAKDGKIATDGSSKYDHDGFICQYNPNKLRPPKPNEGIPNVEVGPSSNGNG